MLKKYVSLIHKSTKRNYIERVTKVDKAKVAKKAIKWSYDYWDGSRDTGYGGYKYDGRWSAVAKALVKAYKLKPGMSVLDVGCGKGFLLHDLLMEVPGLKVYGIDVSTYALKRCMPSVKNTCKYASANKLPFSKNKFDLIISINTLHNLYNYELFSAFKEIKRVMKKNGNSFICVEAYRNEEEKVNLMYWQLTCRTFHTPKEWQHVFNITDYKGDFEFIYFE